MTRAPVCKPIASPVPQLPDCVQTLWLAGAAYRAGTGSDSNSTTTELAAATETADTTPTAGEHGPKVSGGETPAPVGDKEDGSVTANTEGVNGQTTTLAKAKLGAAVTGSLQGFCGKV